MRFHEIKFFDGSKSIVEAQDGVISLPYDGSLLYNIRPASVLMTFTADSDSESIAWDDERPGVLSVTHNLSCYPIVMVYDAENIQVYPDVKVISGNQFELDFQCPTCPVGENETWKLSITYGSEYGSGSFSGDTAMMASYISLATQIKDALDEYDGDSTSY